ncbi:MAG: TAXI family TRAP transporter solute-binding subunit [Xenococcaceae cyanobacterium]
MKRRSFLQISVASALLSSLISSGCSESSEQNASDTTSPQAEQPQSLILTTATTGGTFYPVGVAIATLISNKTALIMNAINSAGSAENIQLLKNQEADLAILQGLFGAMAWSGTGRYEGNPEQEFRAITLLWQNVEHFVIPKEFANTGNIEDLNNIKAKSFSIGKRGSGTEISGRTILSELGFDVDRDFRPEYIGYSESAAALQDGRIAGMNIPAGVPASAITQTYAAMKADRIAILEFTDSQLTKINTTFPVWQPYQIEANTYPGQEQPINTIAQSNFLAVRPAIDEETVYQITKTIYENLGELQEFHPATKEMSLDKAISGLTTPLHPGAIKYYQEQGLEIPAELLAT